VRHRVSFGFDFKLRSFIPKKATTAAIMRLSLPIIIFGFLMSVSNIFINSNVNAYGVAASAVDGIGNKLNMIANAITMGIYTGGAAIVGQCFGAGKHKRIGRVFKLTEGLSLIIWLITAAVMLIFARQIFRAFTADGDVLAMAQNYMWIAVLFYLGMSLATGPFALFEGVGNTNLEMWAGILENLGIKIGLSALFSRFFGLYGYWLGAALSSFTTPVVGFIYYFSRRWEKRKVSLPTDSENKV
jgi:Na+-driven multidrug efflux pump